VRFQKKEKTLDKLNKCYILILSLVFMGFFSLKKRPTGIGGLIRSLLDNPPVDTGLKVVSLGVSFYSF